MYKNKKNISFLNKENFLIILHSIIKIKIYNIFNEKQDIININLYNEKTCSVFTLDRFFIKKTNDPNDQIVFNEIALFDTFEFEINKIIEEFI